MIRYTRLHSCKIYECLITGCKSSPMCLTVCPVLFMKPHTSCSLTNCFLRRLAHLYYFITYTNQPITCTIKLVWRQHSLRGENECIRKLASNPSITHLTQGSMFPIVVSNVLYRLYVVLMWVFCGHLLSHESMFSSSPLFAMEPLCILLSGIGLVLFTHNA